MKTITESQKQVKITALQKEREALSFMLKNANGTHKCNGLTAKIKKIDEQIKKVSTGERFTRQEKRNLIAYTFIAPNFIGFSLFILGPIIFAFLLAFMKWDGNSPMQFAGLINFIDMFANFRFRASFVNTIAYCLTTVPLTLISALSLAVVLNQKVKGKNFFRTVGFFPYVASLVAVGAVWNMLFSPMKNGPVNMLLYNLGVHLKSLPKWSADPHWVMFTIVLFSVWKNMGYYMVIYLAGLQGINGELYEAAGLDGCNAWQKFRYITWPQLQPTTFFVTIILTINCFKVYDIVYMLAGGSNGIVSSQAIVLVYHIYEEAFRNWKLGYASAVAMVLFLMVLVITLVQFRGEKKYAN